MHQSETGRDWWSSNQRIRNTLFVSESAASWLGMTVENTEKVLPEKDPSVKNDTLYS